jgi:hypothetical protein
LEGLGKLDWIIGDPLPLKLIDSCFYPLVFLLEGHNPTFQILSGYRSSQEQEHPNYYSFVHEAPPQNRKAGIMPELLLFSSRSHLY